MLTIILIIIVAGLFFKETRRLTIGLIVRTFRLIRELFSIMVTKFKGYMPEEDCDIEDITK